MGNQTRSPATIIVVSLVLLVDSCTGGGGGCTWTMSAGTRITCRYQGFYTAVTSVTTVIGYTEVHFTH